MYVIIKTRIFAFWRFRLLFYEKNPIFSSLFVTNGRTNVFGSSFFGPYWFLLPMSLKNFFKIRQEIHNGHLRWKVEGYLGGKRIREFFRTKTEAQTRAEQRNIETHNFGQKLGAMPETLRAEALACMERLEDFEVSLTDVVDYWLEKHDWQKKSKPVKDVWEELQAQFERRERVGEISKIYLVSLKRDVEKLVREFGDEQICNLSTNVLERWLVSLPLGPVSRNNVRTAVYKVFKYALKHGWIEKNPVTDIEPANTRRILAQKEPGILTPEEASNLLVSAERLDPELVPHLAIGLFAGLRVAEIGRLDWARIDFEERLIDVQAKIAKTSEQRYVKMSPNLVAWLLPYRKVSGPILPSNGIERLVEFRKRAGFKWRTEEKANALRHSFCSYHFALHQDAAATAAEAGHLTADMLFKVYRARVKQATAEKYFSIFPVQADNILKIA